MSALRMAWVACLLVSLMPFSLVIRPKTVVVPAARIPGIGGLDQVAESNVQGFGDPIQSRQADVLLAGFDGHQHSSADAGFFRQRRLAQLRDMSQATYVLTDVLKDGGALRRIFVH